MNNKGFSLVELIIVIAIMAILAGALAPALLRYIEKTRVSNDKTTAANMKTAVETALATEEVMDAVVTNAGSGNFVLFKVTPATSTADAQYATGTTATTCPVELKNEIEQTLSSKKLKIKSKKDLNQEIWVAIALGGAGQADVVEVYLVQKSDSKYVDTQGVKLNAAPTRADLITTTANNQGTTNVTPTT
ncbi:MAG: prepilin-type N-terminal cleavage/methylation domain-containing protein [Lachnospiraceae bacterium]|nr:prepilin-type N-terminal cleavage/methylation domain-containing protein [Lachnospiraceae bacterium]